MESNRKLNPILRQHQRLESEENKRSGAIVFLAQIFSSIAYAHGLTDRVNGQLRYDVLLKQYIKKLERIRYNKQKLKGEHQTPVDEPAKNSVRGNIQKQLSSPKMTWNVFCSAMRLLQIARLDFTINAHTWDGKMTTHRKSLNFSRNDDQTFLSEFAANDLDYEQREHSGELPDENGEEY